MTEEEHPEDPIFLRLENAPDEDPVPPVRPRKGDEEAPILNHSLRQDGSDLSTSPMVQEPTVVQNLDVPTKRRLEHAIQEADKASGIGLNGFFVGAIRDLYVLHAFEREARAQNMSTAVLAGNILVEWLSRKKLI